MNGLLRIIALVLLGIPLLAYGFLTAITDPGSGPSIPSYGGGDRGVYGAGERETADAHAVHAACTEAASSSRERRDFTYFTCYVSEMVSRPQRLCDHDVKKRFIRYTRSYFAALHEYKQMAADQRGAKVLKIFETLHNGTDIDSGIDSSPSREVRDGLVTLAREGALSLDDFGGFFRPDAPEQVTTLLHNIRAEKANCR